MTFDPTPAWNTKPHWSPCRNGNLNQQSEPEFLDEIGSGKPDRSLSHVVGVVRTQEGHELTSMATHHQFGVRDHTSILQFKLTWVPKIICIKDRNVIPCRLIPSSIPRVGSTPVGFEENCLDSWHRHMAPQSTNLIPRAIVACIIYDDNFARQLCLLQRRLHCLQQGFLRIKGRDYDTNR